MGAADTRASGTYQCKGPARARAPTRASETDKREREPEREGHTRARRCNPNVEKERDAKLLDDGRKRWNVT